MLPATILPSVVGEPAGFFHCCACAFASRMRLCFSSPFLPIPHLLLISLTSPSESRYVPYNHPSVTFTSSSLPLLGRQIFCMFHKCASFRLTSLFFVPSVRFTSLPSPTPPALLFVIRQSNLLCAQLLTINLFSTSSNMDPSICAPGVPLYEGRGEVTEHDGFIKDVNDLCALVNQGIEHIPDFPRDHTPTILSLWAASGDEQRMKNAGIDMYVCHSPRLRAF